jgi:hypothetical protein
MRLGAHDPARVSRSALNFINAVPPPGRFWRRWRVGEQQAVVAVASSFLRRHPSLRCQPSTASLPNAASPGPDGCYDRRCAETQDRCQPSAGAREVAEQVVNKEGNDSAAPARSSRHREIVAVGEGFGEGRVGESRLVRTLLLPDLRFRVRWRLCGICRRAFRRGFSERKRPR